jgi:hypothetical protein
MLYYKSLRTMLTLAGRGNILGRHVKNNYDLYIACFLCIKILVLLPELRPLVLQNKLLFYLGVITKGNTHHL